MATDRFALEAEGLEEALRRMRNLPPAIRKKGAQFALRKGANLVRDKARQNVRRLDDPNTPQDIGANITVRTSSRYHRRTGNVMLRVGVRGGASSFANERWERAKGKAAKRNANPGGDTFYWRFLEFGTRHIAAKPFMRPALANNVQPVIDETARHMNRWLDRNIPKLRARGKI